MTWTNISDQSPSWSPDTDEQSFWINNNQLIPSLNSSDNWDITTNAGEASITGGTLTSVNWDGLINPVPRVSPVVGNIYQYNIIIDSFTKNDGTTWASLSFGGNFIFSSESGHIAGTYTGELEASSSLGLVYSSGKIFGTASSDIVISYISIIEKRIPSTTWSDDTASSSWTPLTDKTTVWS